MAGFFTRLFDRILGKPDEPTEPPPPPVEQPPTGGGRQPNRYLAIWRSKVTRRATRADTQRTGFSERELIERHLETFLSLPGMAEEDASERYGYWDQYIDAFVLDRRDKKEWLREIGYDARDYDWQEWRETRGYTRGK